MFGSSVTLSIGTRQHCTMFLSFTRCPSPGRTHSCHPVTSRTTSGTATFSRQGHTATVPQQHSRKTHGHSHFIRPSRPAFLVSKMKISLDRASLPSTLPSEVNGSILFGLLGH